MSNNYSVIHLPSASVWRRVLIMSSIAAIIVSAVTYAYYQQRIADEWGKISVEEVHHVQIQRAVLSQDLRHIAYTLAFLRDQVLIHGLTDLKPDIVSFSEDLFSFLNSNELYDQIRFLDVNGMEVVRVDYNHGSPFIVPKSKLQNKGEKDYFKAGNSLKKDEIYISPLDLNMERGEVERPFKPVVRFSMPVFNHSGDRQGVLIINHLAADMLKRFSVVGTPTAATAMLLNMQGYWLSHPDSDRQWGFMFADRTGQTMRKTDPQLWAGVMTGDSGQFKLNGAIISFSTVYPFQEFAELSKILMQRLPEKMFWKAVSYYPAAELDKNYSVIRNRVILTAVAFVVIFTVLFFFLATNRQRKIDYGKAIRIRDRAIEEATGGIVICDARQEDHPIIYCNAAFEKITGFAHHEVLGKNCRFLQNDDCDQEGAAQMHQALAAGESCQVTIRNYRKDGTQFWNELTISPVHDQNGTLTHFIGYQADVSWRKQDEMEKEKLLNEIRGFSHRLIDARDEERAEIARSLHDDIGQKVTAIQLKASLAHEQCHHENCEQAKRNMDDISRVAGELLETVRSQLRIIRPGHLAEIGLVEALRDMCTEWEESRKITVNFEANPMPEHMSAQFELNVFHIVQEALTNIVRHAGASKAAVELKFEDDQMYLKIADNGLGFNSELAADGMGLTGMRERVQGLQGTLVIKSKKGQGSTLMARIPYR